MLQHVRIGDKVLVNFPALPGRVFVTKVFAIPTAIGDVQTIASGQLPMVQQQRMTRLYPVYIELPEDFPQDLHNIGLAANPKPLGKGFNCPSNQATVPAPSRTEGLGRGLPDRGLRRAVGCGRRRRSRRLARPIAPQGR